MSSNSEFQMPFGAALQNFSHRKAALRARMRQVRRELTPEFRAHASAAIAQRLLARSCYQCAATIHTYVAWQEEAGNHDLLRAMLAEGKALVTPKVKAQTKQLENFLIPNFSALAPGAFGILEPSSARGALRFAALREIDLIIVPGLAFDREGNRLGYGGGYYDRLLAEIAAPKVALAFAAQIVESVPAEAHDERVDCIVTEEEVISCGAA